MTMSAKNFWVVIPAAGSGSRMQQSTPKQYLSLNGRPVLDYSLNVFYLHPAIEQIVVVGDQQDVRLLKIIEPYQDKVLLAPGGETRAESVANGLSLVAEKSAVQDSVWVMVHDAARPCLTDIDLNALIESSERFTDGALLVAPVVDTLKQCSEERVTQTHNREQFALALTPQMAPLSHLREALSLASTQGVSVTDEAQALELAGFSVGTVAGRRDNIKITYPEDLALASFFLSQR